MRLVTTDGRRRRRRKRGGCRDKTKKKKHTHRDVGKIVLRYIKMIQNELKLSSMELIEHLRKNSFEVYSPLERRVSAKRRPLLFSSLLRAMWRPVEAVLSPSEALQLQSATEEELQSEAFRRKVMKAMQAAQLCYKGEAFLLSETKIESHLSKT